VAHPYRVRIVIELRDHELDVNSIQQILGISHSAVSQNLAVLRTHHVVQERREGRHVFYSLVNREMANWLMSGINFVEGGLARSGEMLEAVESARELWHEGGR
jgi:DNA-binding transcriptional ArsR family regulator